MRITSISRILLFAGLLALAGLLSWGQVESVQAAPTQSSGHSSGHYTAVIATGALNVRSGPGITFNRTAAVYQGNTVTLLGRNQSATWVKIQMANGHQGWVNVAYTFPSVAVVTLPVVDAPAPPSASATAVVNTGALNVRSGPSVAHTVVAVAQQGFALQLLGRNANSSWAKVRLTSGQEGWVNASLITPSVPISSLPMVDAPGVTPTAVVNTGALNVRSGPGVSYSVVTWVQQGQTLSLLGRNANSSWVQVRTAGNHTGWVNASLIQANVAVSSLPVVGAAAPTGTAVVSTGALNVRYGPGVSYGAFAAVYQGTTVSLLGRNQAANWVKIQLPNGNQGWVNAAFLQASVAIVNLPVVG
ncbi:MAG: SH3 domain-containing protein [Chloroflexota bacterium]|jgi:N-acetylmuramoyl-L-alanine amidase